jgi:hypothetical protein
VALNGDAAAKVAMAEMSVGGDGGGDVAVQSGSNVNSPPSSP